MAAKALFALLSTAHCAGSVAETELAESRRRAAGDVRSRLGNIMRAAALGEMAGLPGSGFWTDFIGFQQPLRYP